MSELREFAASTYNRAFELVVEGSAEDVIEGLELAAASLQAWRKVGTDKNVAIGLWLYSRALFKSGLQQQAIAVAEESLKLATLDGTDWLIASSLEGLARASQNQESFDSLRQQAEAAIASIADAEDRQLIADQFSDLR